MRGRFTRRRWLAAGAAFVIIGGLAFVLLLAAFGRYTIEGSIRPALQLHSPDGGMVQLISPYGRRHLVLFFLVSCPHCHEVLDHLRRLRPYVASCDLFAVSLSDSSATASYAATWDDPFPVWTMSPHDALLQLGIRRVPSLLFVSETDRVDWVRTGARSFLEDSVLIVRYCDGGSSGLSAVDSLGEDGSPTVLGDASGQGGRQRY